MVNCSLRLTLTSSIFWESLEKLHSNGRGGRVLIHNGDVMAAVIDPPLNPVRIRENGSTRLPGSCYSGWLGAPEPPVRGQMGLGNPTLLSPYWALNHTGGCSSLIRSTNILLLGG